MNQNYPFVSLITVNFNGVIHSRSFLKSLEKVSYSNYEVWAVDNASTASILPLKEAFKSVNFIESKENLGFAGGNNLAM